jgi:hypothetical protein
MKKIICYILLPDEYSQELFTSIMDCIKKLNKSQQEIDIIYDKPLFLNLLNKFEEHAILHKEYEMPIQDCSQEIDNLRNRSVYDNQTYKDKEANYWLWNKAEATRIDNILLSDVTERVSFLEHDALFIIMNFRFEMDRDIFLPVFKDAKHNPNLPKFAHIPTICLTEISDIRKWVYKNITLKECLSDNNYKLVCKELGNQDSKLFKRLEEFDFDSWNIRQNPFPMVLFSDYLFPEQNPEKYVEDRSNRNTTDIEKRNKSFAIINGYSPEDNLTAINREKSGKLREIFVAKNKGNTIYISTDFKSGEFEVCDNTGTWIAAYGYAGKEIKKSPAERKKYIIEHSIILKK